MAVRNEERAATSRGAWTADEDRRLSEYIEIHGPRRWKNIATKAGLSRCGKSCRLRWLNYLRPNIKRGNISGDEEDLILRLHKLLGNRWSLIAGRLPGRTDNEIKNYWNSHLSKRIKAGEKAQRERAPPTPMPPPPSFDVRIQEEPGAVGNGDSGIGFEVDDLLLDFTVEGSCGMEWINKLLEHDH